MEVLRGRAGRGEELGERDAENSLGPPYRVTLSQMPLADTEHLHFKWRCKKWKEE